jgi:hypothetical protein
MAAEALLTLEQKDVIIPWVQKYRKRLPGYPENLDIINGERWHEAIGDIHRFADLTLFFKKQL